MVVYEVFLRREGKKGEFIGVLPERRNNKERVNTESIMNWSKTVFDGTLDASELFSFERLFEKRWKRCQRVSAQVMGWTVLRRWPCWPKKSNV
jgi:hypothetical protein